MCRYKELSDIGGIEVEEFIKFKKMYLKLFNAVTDALEETDKAKSDEILKKAQCDCEEIYIEED